MICGIIRGALEMVQLEVTARVEKVFLFNLKNTKINFLNFLKYFINTLQHTDFDNTQCLPHFRHFHARTGRNRPGR